MGKPAKKVLGKHIGESNGAKWYEKESTNTINPRQRLIRPIEWIGPQEDESWSPNSFFFSYILSRICTTIEIPNFEREEKGKKIEREREKKKQRKKDEKVDGSNGRSGMISLLLSIPVTPCKTMQRTWRLLIKWSQWDHNRNMAGADTTRCTHSISPCVNGTAASSQKASYLHASV